MSHFQIPYCDLIFPNFALVKVREQHEFCLVLSEFAVTALSYCICADFYYLAIVLI